MPIGELGPSDPIPRILWGKQIDYYVTAEAHDPLNNTQDEGGPLSLRFLHLGR